MPRALATAARQPPPEGAKDEPVNVLVTGFGPFLDNIPVNSSWEIASRLPALLPATPSHPTPIHIRVHHEPIRVAYKTVLDLVPKLLPSNSSASSPTVEQPHPDIILHIGLAASRPFYTLEQGSHGLGYGALTDVDGELFPDVQSERKFFLSSSSSSTKSPMPARLETSFNTSDILTRWRTALGYTDPSSESHSPSNARPNSHDDQAENSIEPASYAQHVQVPPPDVRLSNDAGNFMCGFIYFNSLAHYYHHDADSGKDEGNKRPVVFLHVPDLSTSQERLDQGKRVAIALIRALVASRKEKGLVDKTPMMTADGTAREGAVGDRTDANFVS